MVGSQNQRAFQDAELPSLVLTGRRKWVSLNEVVSAAAVGIAFRASDCCIGTSFLIVYIAAHSEREKHSAAKQRGQRVFEGMRYMRLLFLI